MTHSLLPLLVLTADVLKLHLRPNRIFGPAPAVGDWGGAEPGCPRRSVPVPGVLVGPQHAC